MLVNHFEKWKLHVFENITPIKDRTQWEKLPTRFNHIEYIKDRKLLKEVEKHQNLLVEDLLIKLNWIQGSFYPIQIPNIKEFVPKVEHFEMLKKRWDESQKSYLGGAYMASIVMLGSFMEGLLIEILTKYQHEFINLQSSPKHKESKIPLKLESWQLEKMIHVCHELGLVDKNMKTLMHYVQEMRNYIHPSLEKTSNQTINVETCDTAQKAIHQMIVEILNSEKWTQTC